MAQRRKQDITRFLESLFRVSPKFKYFFINIFLICGFPSVAALRRVRVPLRAGLHLLPPSPEGPGGGQHTHEEAER